MSEINQAQITARYRKEFYGFITKLLGRNLTPDESDEIKHIIKAYVRVEAGRSVDIEETMQRQGARINELKKTMLGKLSSFIDKPGIDPEKVEILKGLVAELKS